MHACTWNQLFLFELEKCVEHACYKLNQYMHGVSEKFKYFVSFLRQIILLINAILQTNLWHKKNFWHKIYHKNSIIECELIVYGLNYIVHVELNIKYISLKIYLFPHFFILSSYLRNIKLFNKKVRPADRLIPLKYY